MADVTVTAGTDVLVSSSSGVIAVTDAQSDIVVGTALNVNGVAVGANVGSGDAEVYRDVTGTILNFRTLSGAGGVAVSEVGDVVQIDGSVLQNVLLSHADRHKHGGGDEVASATPGANLIPKADGTGKLDSGWMPTGTFTDEAVSVTSNDTTPGYLDDKIVAGAGLTSTILTPGGDEDYQLDVVANADGSIVVNANDIQVGVLASDAQHGDRGGGSVHALAIASGAAGFLSGTDKQAIDDLATTYAAIAHAATHAGAGSDPITTLGAHAVTGQLELTGTDNEVFLNATNSNLVRFANAGVEAPTTTTRSVGTKILLYDQISPTRTDYAIGLENGGIWFSVSDITTTRQFTWYAGTTPLLYLRGDGLLQFGGQTNTEPAWKREGTALTARLADDSDRTGVQASFYRASEFVEIGTSTDRNKILSPVTGKFVFTDTAETSFSMLIVGEADNTWPAWKANGTQWQARLGDDTGFTSVTASDFTLGVGGSLATHATRHENGGSDEISVAGLSGLLADGQTPLAHVTTHQNGGADELSVTGLSGLLADGQTPLAHASSHAGAGGDAITTLGAVTFTGAIDWTSATVINGLTDSKLLLTDTAGTAFDMIQLGGTTSSYVAVKRNTTSPGPCLESRLADNSNSAYLRGYHIGLNTDPTATHLLFGSEGFTGGSGNRIGVGVFPAYVPGTLAANNVYGVQGNTFFGGANWAANSFVNALQFFPAPDYQYGSVSWGSSNLNLLGISTGGLINIFGRTVTAASLVGISVGTLSHIFGAPGAVSATYAAGIEIVTPSQTTGTIATQTGLIINPQLYGTLNQGLWLNGNAAGTDIVFGSSKSARQWYNGTNLVIDPDNAGSGIVLIGATGDDDMRLTNIEIDGALNHDGTTIGFYNTTPITKPTVTGAKGGNVALTNLLTALANLGLLTDSTT